MAKRTVGSRLLEGYSRIPAGARKYTDGAVRVGSGVVKRLNGEGSRRKGESWASAQKAKVKKRLRKYKL